VLKTAATALACAALAIGGCGSDSGSDTQARTGSTTGVEQSFNGFPGAGDPNAPAVTTTPGNAPEKSPGQAGGGTGGGTCIGC
jgi:hypothetical protein